MDSFTKIVWGAFLLMVVVILLSCGTVFVPWIYGIFKFVWGLHWMFVVTPIAVGIALAGLFLYAFYYAFREANKHPPP